jgi:hypothetical protein
MTDYAALRAFNQKHKLADFLALPMVPSVEMMRAAAERHDVFSPGDRLGDYIVAWDKEHDEEPPAIPASLEAEFGRQKAFEICVLADGWAGCVSGFKEWEKRRGTEGATTFVESWLRAMPVTCPPGGWPATEKQCTEDHSAHARSSDAVNVCRQDLYWQDIDRRRVFQGPSRCLGIMGLRGRQAESATSLFSTFEEMVEHEGLPYVPGYTKVHYFDDEERAALVLSAMWDAAVSSLVTSEAHRPMPMDERSNAIRLVAEMQRWSGFYAEAPHRRLSIETDGGRFEASVSDAGVDWEVEFKSTGDLTRRRGIDLRLSPETELFNDMMRQLDQQVGAAFVSERLQ